MTVGKRPSGTGEALAVLASDLLTHGEGIGDQATQKRKIRSVAVLVDMVDDARRCLPDDPPEEVGSRHVLHSGTKSHGDELRARQSLGHARRGERCRGPHGSKVGPFTQALRPEHVNRDRATLATPTTKP